jgi:hypothetical protein
LKTQNTPARCASSGHRHSHSPLIRALACTNFECHPLLWS